MPILRKIGEWCNRFVWVFPPLVVMLAMLLTFKENALYPFGNQTIAWGDMEQQTVPLLMQFKDVLAGKENFFFSLKNAGGMNFYGVFFFFLSSPFTFLVIFIDKGDILAFCNVLVMLKMCVCALTASVYLSKKNKKASLLNVFLSVLYAYSGYMMMYYQNMMWLDVAYLFPLLLLGLERLQEGKRVLYIAALSLSMIANYYLGYMLVVFLLLYAFVWVILSKNKRFAIDFLLSSLIAALLTAVVWIPSLWQYLTSGRTSSIISNLKYSAVLTSYQTAIPTIFSVLFLFPFALTQKETLDEKLRRILFVATLIPMIFEPINKMWQTGSYMCFPTRYGFMTIFLCISLAFDGLTKREKVAGGFTKSWKKQAPMYVLSVILLGISIAYCVFARAYIDFNAEIIDQYSHSLWGNTNSFEALLNLYVFALMVGIFAFILWHFRLFKPIFLWLSVGVMVFSELYVAPVTYMLTPAHEVEGHQQVVELVDKIDDEGFYRVKTDREYSGKDFDVTLMGGLGYNALGHFTSLTKKNYMETIKRFGYTSYWMEVGNSGGTMITDALLSVKYQISDKKTGADIYQGSAFSISKRENYLPLGVIAQTDIVALDTKRENVTLGEMQQVLYNDFFGTDGITRYELKDANAYNLTVTREGEKYLLTPTSSDAYLRFNVSINASATLYFSAFDENTNALKQGINEKFSVQTSKYYLSSYPTQKRNGMLTLGEYSQNVTVTVGVKEETRVSEMSVLAVDNQKTQSYIEGTSTLGLTVENGKIGGKYEARGGECVFLSIPYDEGLSLKINGKAATLHEVYGGFTAFYLEAGTNEIQITFRSKGFALGLTVSVLGGALLAAGIWFLKRYGKKLSSPVLENISYYGVLAIGAAILLIVYIAPMALCAF